MRRVVIALLCSAAISIGIGSVACQVQGQCSTTPGFVDYCSGSANDVTPCQGHVIDATHWESGPQNASFLNYGAEQQYHMHFRDAVTGQVISGELGNIMIQVSATQDGNGPFHNWINCGDQLCIMNFDGDGSGIVVQNDTCGSYFFRVVVTLIPSSSTDAGTD